MTNDRFAYAFPFSFYVPPKYRRPYVLEVRNNAGELLRKLPRFWDAAMSTIVNEPGELTFSIRAEDEAFDVLTGHNEVWVKDVDDATLGRYRLARREEQVDDTGAYLTLFARGLLSDLAAEPLDEYEATTAINAHLATWFAGQIGQDPVTIGSVSTAIGSLSRAVDLTGQSSILSAIRGLEETLTVATMFWVDSSRVFHWIRLSEVSDRGFQLRAAHNIKSLRRTVDYDAQATRIYAKGRNEGGRYIRILDAAGSTVNYVQSALMTYAFRRQIVIDAMTVPPEGGTNASFNLVLPHDEHLARHVANSSQIAFMSTADAATAIVHTINSYTPATGALDATITIPTLSGVWDTVIYMVYTEAA